MKVKNFSIVVGILCVLLACKKNKTEPEPEIVEPPPAIVYPDYSPYKKGNYWIYERFRVEQHGVSTSLNQFDSVFVVGDTTIANEKWYTLKRFDFAFNRVEFLTQKDSLHYIIREGSSFRTVFSSEDYSSIFYDQFLIIANNDTVCRMTMKMNDKDLKVTTAAGTFKTSNAQTTINFYPNYIKPGLNSPRYMNTRYAKGVGIITETEPYYVSADYGTERRLIRYKVN